AGGVRVLYLLHIHHLASPNRRLSAEAGRARLGARAPLRPGVAALGVVGRTVGTLLHSGGPVHRPQRRGRPGRPGPPPARRRACWPGTGAETLPRGGKRSAPPVLLTQIPSRIEDTAMRRTWIAAAALALWLGGAVPVEAGLYNMADPLD